MKKYFLCMTALFILSGCAGLKQAHRSTDHYLAVKQVQATRVVKQVKDGLRIRPVTLDDYLPVDDFTVKIRPNEVSLTPGLYIGISFTF